MNLSRTNRWHLRNVAIIFFAMYGWALLRDDDFFNLTSLATRFLAFLVVVGVYLIGVRLFKFGPPPEFPADGHGDGGVEQTITEAPAEPASEAAEASRDPISEWESPEEIDPAESAREKNSLD